MVKRVGCDPIQYALTAKNRTIFTHAQRLTERRWQSPACSAAPHYAISSYEHSDLRPRY